jgi:hypothetical protein
MRGSKHKPTDKTRIEVAALRSYGHTHEDIAKFLDISSDCLCSHYSRELETAQIIANAEVARKLYGKATKGDDLQAQIFWLKTRARWRTEDVESVIHQNESLKQEMAELRAQLDEKYKKDF